MSQLDLFQQPEISPAARQTDPWTSHVAAGRAVEFQQNHIDIITDCLTRNGPLTADEIAEHTPLNSVQICRRLTEMHRKGIAAPTGHCRASASGRPERVWAAA